MGSPWNFSICFSNISLPSMTTNTSFLTSSSNVKSINGGGGFRLATGIARGTGGIASFGFSSLT